eukprot:3952770-Pyramimonas_sp.AAC.1
MGSVRGVDHDLAAFDSQLQGRHPGVLLPEPHDGRSDARRDDETDPRRLIIVWVRRAGENEEKSGIRDGELCPGLVCLLDAHDVDVHGCHVPFKFCLLGLGEALN